MIRKISTIAIAAIMSVSLIACAQDRKGNKELTGAAIGGALGGLLGSQFGGGKGKLAATALGVAAGLFIGSEIGRSLDKADRMHANRTANQALENNKTGETSTWSNPDSGHSGSVTPTRTVREESRVCREYEQTINVDGRTETATGTACRRPDGTWQIVS